MIYITKESTNTIVLELAPSDPTVFTGYLFRFEYEGRLDRPVYWFYTPDVSPAPSRYQEFELVETATGATGAVNNIPISLYEGQWRYDVYGSFTSADPSDPTTAPWLIQTGRMLVES
jgi:hypothetical protein